MQYHPEGGCSWSNAVHFIRNEDEHQLIKQGIRVEASLFEGVVRALNLKVGGLSLE